MDIKKIVIAGFSLLLVIGLVLIVFLPNKEHKEEVKSDPKKSEEVQKAERDLAEMNHKKIEFKLYKKIIDKAHGKVMFVFAKNRTDLMSNFKFYIENNGEKKELEAYQNDEQMLVLETDINVNGKFKIIMDNNGDISYDEFDLTDAVEYDLTKATKDQFRKHEELSHKIIAVNAQIKIAKENLDKEKDTLSFTDNKIKNYKSKGENDKAKRYEDNRQEVVDNVTKYQKQLDNKNLELKKLLDDNEELENMFNTLFGGLHKH